MTIPNPRLNWLALLLLLVTLFTFGVTATTSPVLAQDEDSDEHMEDEEHEDEDYDEEDEWEEDPWADEFFLDMKVYTSIIELVDQMTSVASSPNTSAVAAIMGVDNYVEQDEQLAFFNKMLTELDASNEEHVVAARAIRIRLSEIYGDQDQPDKALEQLRLLILNQPLDN